MMTTGLTVRLRKTLENQLPPTYTNKNGDAGINLSRSLH